MTIDDQVKEKTAQLSSINQEISELNARKSGLVKEINTELLDSRAKADKLISDAEIKSNAINAEIDSAKKLAERYVSKIKQEADDLLASAQTISRQNTELRTAIDKERVDFNAEKFAFESDIRTKKNEANNLISQANNAQKELDSKKIDLGTREATVTRRELANVAATDQLAQGVKDLKEAQEDLAKRELALKEERKSLDAISKANNDLLADIDKKRQQIDADRLASQKLSDETLIQKQKNDEDKKLISSYFATIEQNNKELEERKISLDERQQLLDIKDKEIIQKIKINSELRMKKNVV